MKILILWAFLAFAVVAIVADSNECGGDPEKDGEIKAWFKSAGCTIKKTYDDVSNSAKPYADTIATKAKEFGHTVAQTYGDVKHKLTDSGDNHQEASSAAYVEGPTEKVPLAPLPGQQVEPKPSTTGEVKHTGEPDSFDDRFLLQNNECPKGMALDHTKRCRPAI